MISLFECCIGLCFQHAKARVTDSSSDEDNNQANFSRGQENRDYDFEIPESERIKIQPAFKGRISDTKSGSAINIGSLKDTKSCTHDNLSKTLSVKNGQQQPLLLHFPSEITLKIFSYLGPKDLCQCAQVCRQWSQAAKDGVLWRELYPVRWIFKKDWRFGCDTEGNNYCTCDCDSEVQISDGVPVNR